MLEVRGASLFGDLRLRAEKSIYLKRNNPQT
jgi:hypothetical protein